MKSLFVIFLMIFLGACSSSRFVKPLNKNERAVAGSFGGPIIKQFGAAIPIPFLTIGGGYGIDSSLTVHGAMNLTSGLFGNMQIELGCTKNLLNQKNKMPGVSIAPQINFISHLKPAVINIYPQLDLNAYWEYGSKKNLFYVGTLNWFELQNKKAHNLKQENRWIFAPQIGHTFNCRLLKFNAELKYIAPFTRNDYIVVDYLSPTKGNGALGIYFGVTKIF